MADHNEYGNERGNGRGNDVQVNQSVMVIGAGIAGMQSALLLAETGYRVVLLDQAPGIGGSMHLLDLTFPTDSCGLCLMLPGRAAYCPTIECDLHANIEILPYAEVVGVRGEPGDLTVTVRRKPRYVHVDRCTNCGRCAEVCPVERPDRYEGALKMGKAIYRPPTRAIPPAYVIDMDVCTRCGKCVAVCPTEAIDLEMAEETVEFPVGALLLSPGFEPFDARRKGEFGFGRYDNVVTSIQFDRMLSISGSTGATVLRPSDHTRPRRLAFIQCVGSRDETVGCGYCSSVCCMYTAKQVAVAKKLHPNLEITVFFMDVRAYGKDFDTYFDQVAALPGVTYRRAMVSAIHQYQQTRDLALQFVAEDGSLREEDFDMVVLAVGFVPPVGFRQLGQALDLPLNTYGFCVTDTFSPQESGSPGVLVGGAFREPKDIPETVVEASAAAAEAARLLGPVKRPLPGVDAHAVPPTGDLEAWPRVGVFLCDCRGEIGEAVDLEALAMYAGGLRDVVWVQRLDNACLSGGVATISNAIAEHDLNRVVLAGCAARLYEPTFARMMTEAGLSAGLLERVNLRGEVAWVHGNGKGEGDGHRGAGDAAAEKARELLAMGVAGARLRKSLPARQAPSVAARALVIGGGLAGMTAALTLADMGYGVDLVERSDKLGGQLRELRYTLSDRDDPAAFLATLTQQVEAQARITIHRRARVTAVEGTVGQFETTVASADGEPFHLQHGAIVVATGGREVQPTSYLYGQDARVLTQRELEHRLAAGEPIPSRVVMIQCVESREPERPYCSRICCTKAVINALEIKKHYPQTDVFVLYREMRTYGFREDAYREARRQGVVFLRYELPDRPQVTAGENGLSVRWREPVAGDEVLIEAEMLVLSTGIEPYREEAQALADILEVPLDANGFFKEEYPKMRPLDFTRRGIFVCGLAHSPRAADETITQARAAAMRAAAVLTQTERSAVTSAVATVSIKRCSACGLCVEACPFGARVLEPGALYAEVIETLCQGCGTCVAICPNKASGQREVEVKQIYEMLHAVSL